MLKLSALLKSFGRLPAKRSEVRIPDPWVTFDSRWRLVVLPASDCTWPIEALCSFMSLQILGSCFLAPLARVMGPSSYEVYPFHYIPAWNMS